MNSISTRSFIHKNCAKIRSSDRTLKAIYEVSFDTPQKTMVEFTRNGIDESMTYGQVRALCEKAAGRLARTNSQNGRFIGLYADNCVGWLILFWAILLSGNKPFLINTIQPHALTKRNLKTLDVDTVLFVGKAPGLAETEIDWETLIQGDEEKEQAAIRPFGNEIALTTSGSTLQEKICVYTGAELSEQILNTEAIFAVNPDILKHDHGRMKMLMLLPLYHIFGFVASFLWFTIFKTVFVFPPDKSPATLLQTIRDHQITHLFAVPLFWRSVEKMIRRRLRAMPEDEQEKLQSALSLSIKRQSFCTRTGRHWAENAFYRIRRELFGDAICFCISGGSRLSSSTLELFNALGYPLCNGYGMSEIGIASVELSRKIEDRLKNAIGKPFRSVRFALSEDGRLRVCGTSICKRLYVNGVPEEPGEWFDTGDLMECDRDGRYYFRARESDLVFGDAGEKLNPDVAQEVFDLPHAVAFSVLGDENNEKLVMVIQLPRDLPGLLKKRVFESYQESNALLPAAYRVQKAYYTYDAVVSEGGVKLSRAQLRRGLDDGSVRVTDLCAEFSSGTVSDDDVTAVVRALMAEALSLEESQISDDAHFFFDLGGSSLDYLTLISLIDNRFDITMDFEAEGAGYSLNELSQSVKDHLLMQ